MSRFGELSQSDTLRILTHAGIVGSSAAITYIIMNLSNIHFGSYDILIIPALSIALKSLLLFLTDNTKGADNDNQQP